MTTQPALALRNIAIIAHVDHGKTTLVDCLLQETGMLKTKETELVMDSNDLEKERGITILAKNTSIRYKDHVINIIDTPGHADFGGEVERILSMADAVLLLVDAVEGPMPQTRFVTQKAFAQNLKPILVINKIDRPGSRPDWVLDKVIDLFFALDATEEQLEFPTIYTSALQGYATSDPDVKTTDMSLLLDMILREVRPPQVDRDAPFQMQISALDYSSYVGTIGIGRITRGVVREKMPVVITHAASHELRQAKIGQLLGFVGLERQPILQAEAGDIIAVTGIDELTISDTLCDPSDVIPLPALSIDEPTIQMTFQVNDSPFAGKDGKFVTSRKIRERLATELKHNVALRVEDTVDPDKFLVSGRGELHLSILIETMRREGYELAISRPRVITKISDEGETLEPYEHLTVDIPDTAQGRIMEKLGARKAELLDMQSNSQGRVRLDYRIPARGLIGFQNEFMTSTSGEGLMHHVFEKYGPQVKSPLAQRNNGVLVAVGPGQARAYALWNLQERGRLLIHPQTEVYEGMVVGIHARQNDLVVNVTKEKKLTNIRAAGSDENILLTPPVLLSLEQAITFINDDELVEVTPHYIRIRKQYLKENQRKRA